MYLSPLSLPKTQPNVPLARYTAARIGGPADLLVIVESADELAESVVQLWDAKVPFIILGRGSNVLASDTGIRGAVLLNHARHLRFDKRAEPPVVWAESGANFGTVARQAATRGLSGLEWACGIPGTVGGAVVGNAGAHAGDMAGNLMVAEILHREHGRQQWPVEKLKFDYRHSILKSQSTPQPVAVVLSARLRLAPSTPDRVQAKMDEFTEKRRRTQPPGASMGSMFKNPPGDYAGRLIEAAGLKGTRFGAAEISTVHANFFINRGQATAADFYALIQLTQKTVSEKFGIKLELEIELVGEW